MAKLIGMGGSVEVSSATYPVGEWSANVTNDVQDVTDTGSNGWVARLAGVSSCEVTFRAFWGSATGSLAAAFSPGTVVALTLNIGTSGIAVTGSFVVSSATITNGAKTPVEFQCTAQSNGEVTIG